LPKLCRKISGCFSANYGKGKKIPYPNNGIIFDEMETLTSLGSIEYAGKSRKILVKRFLARR
jgi:hypothetical protein